MEIFFLNVVKISENDLTLVEQYIIFPQQTCY
jgi:hypothetical protein